MAHPSGFDAFAARLTFSYVDTLRVDPDSAAPRADGNRAPRPVRSGHFVPVAPRALRAPYLVTYSPELTSALGLSAEDCEGAPFLRAFSGDLRGAPPAFRSAGWATPYALSIYGNPTLPNGAGNTGLGYGDGRAISIGEAHPPPGGGGGGGVGAGGLELQLKGGGATPFARGSDGAAVLRSSVREFLASEAMHALGVPTTRALSLVACAEEKVQRPWFSEALGLAQPGTRGGEMDVLVQNRRAITTRAATSFLRVGQFELYGRRAALGLKLGEGAMRFIGGLPEAQRFELFGRRAVGGEPVPMEGDENARVELEMLARHALAREYPALAPADAAAPLQPALLAMLREASSRLAALAAHWLRVGYNQGNFNADNCLVGGATMDYGPFGFLERYDPAFGMWVGSGQHFSFSNQPRAAERNFMALALSLLPLLDAEGQRQAEIVFGEHRAVSDAAVAATWARKLGFGAAGAAAAAPVWAALDGILQAHPTDFTIAFRQLSALLPVGGWEEGGGGGGGEGCPLERLQPLEAAFYAPKPGPAVIRKWRQWVPLWLDALRAAGVSPQAAAETMRAANPKFVPREWLLVEAYTAAESGDHAPLKALQRVLARPYDEQPDADAKFYRTAPEGTEKMAGVGFMS